MQTIKVNLYEFKELSEDIQRKVLDHHRYRDVDGNWWDNVWYDARETAKIDITAHDTYYKTINGKFLNGAYVTAETIKENHGETTETYKTAVLFLAEYSKLNPDDDDGLEELENKFLKGILKCYLEILQSEYDYLISDPAVIDSLESAEKVFLIDGTEWKHATE